MQTGTNRSSTGTIDGVKRETECMGGKISDNVLIYLLLGFIEIKSNHFFNMKNAHLCK